MLSDLKQCVNSACRRYQVLVQNVNSPNCSECQQPLHEVDLENHSLAIAGQQVLIDLGEQGNFEGLLPQARQIPSFSSGPEGMRFRPDQKPQQRVSDTFRCQPDVEGCPVAKKPSVEVPNAVFNNWVFLACEIDTEWIAYLRGEAIEGGYHIHGFYFPKQRVTPAHCEPEDGEVRFDDTIGTVHSHVSMGAVFSPEDRSHFNWPVEIVINRRGEFSVNCRQKLECGNWQRNEGRLVLAQCDAELELVKELQEKMTDARRGPGKPTGMFTVETVGKPQ